MSEKRLLNCILVEGIVLIILSLCVLILPKLTMLSYGVMLSGTFITYGAYKIMHSILNKEYRLRKVFSILMGTYLSAIGISLLFVPRINLLWLIALIGVYFIAESISSLVYALKLRNIYHFWGCKIISAIVLFLVGFFTILGIPVMSFWMVTILSATALLIKGMAKTTLALGNIDNYNA